MTVHALMIDDDPDSRAIAALSLDLHPRIIVTAMSRRDASSALLHGVASFDVILLDVKRSDASPGPLVAAMRRWPGSAATPVVILSHGIDIPCPPGALGTIRKPLDPVALPDRLIALLEPR